VQQRTYTILGVMPASFQFPYGAASGFPGALPESRTDLWVADSRMSGQGGRLEVVGRLRPDASIEAAARELDLIEKRLDVTAPGPSRAIGVRVESLTVRVIQPIRQSLWILFGAVGLVLAAACLNVANLVLGRTTLRIREVSTRAALGAGRLRLARQFLAESLLLAMAGGIAGSMVALWGNRLLVTLGAARIPRVQEIAIDWRTFAFLLLVCLASGVLFSLAPALTAARPDCHATLKGAGHTTAARRHRRIRDVLIVMQVALAFVLACGASLVIGEMRRLQQTSPGFDPQGVITFHLTPPLADQTEYYRLESRIAQVPGVESTGFANMLPLQNWGWIGSFQIRGRPAAGPPLPTTEIRAVTPGYFQTLRIPIRAGRPPSEHDRLSVPQDILINEAFARQHFPGENPIDQYLNRGRIVGVAGDVQQADVGRSAVPEMYQQLGAGAGIAADLGMSLVVRTRAPADSIVDAVRSALREANPRLAVFNIKTMEQIVVDSFWELNLYRWLIGCFAGLVLLLAVIGLYGVISYSATLRQNEFAIRLALGTSPPALVWLIVRQGLGLASAGLVIGGLTLIAVSPLLRHIRAGITPEPLTYAAMALLVTAIAAVASLVPALRVARVNPSTVLRYE
jgi:putative ABC transport system permease protein